MSEPSIACPRCTHTMTPRLATPRPGARTVRADVCGVCGGIWLDEYELAEVSDQLGALPFRVPELMARRTPEGTPPPTVGRAIAACPRCARAPIAIAVLDVAIDLCPGCRGVWLDGGEYEALGRAAALEAAEKAETTSSYRQAPQVVKVAKLGLFTCPRCAEEHATSDGYLTPRGLTCGPCFHAHEEADLLGEASRDHGELSARFKVGALRPHAGPDGATASRAASSGPLFAVLGALAAAASPMFCQHCGRRRDDAGCTHF